MPGNERARLARAANIAAQKDYARALGERLFGYGHIVSHDASATLATTWFLQLDDRAAAEAFVANGPLSRAGVYERADIRRWSNSFIKRAADYKLRGMQHIAAIRAASALRYSRALRAN